MVYYRFNHIYWLLVSTHPMNITVINWDHPRCRSSTCFNNPSVSSNMPVGMVKKNTHKTHLKTTQNRFWNQHFDGKINEIHWIPPFWNHQPGPASHFTPAMQPSVWVAPRTPASSAHAHAEPCWWLLPWPTRGGNRAAAGHCWGTPPWPSGLTFTRPGKRLHNELENHEDFWRNYN